MIKRKQATPEQEASLRCIALDRAYQSLQAIKDNAFKNKGDDPDDCNFVAKGFIKVIAQIEKLRFDAGDEKTYYSLDADEVFYDALWFAFHDLEPSEFGYEAEGTIGGWLLSQIPAAAKALEAHALVGQFLDESGESGWMNYFEAEHLIKSFK